MRSVTQFVRPNLCPAPLQHTPSGGSILFVRSIRQSPAAARAEQFAGSGGGGGGGGPDSRPFEPNSECVRPFTDGRPATDASVNGRTTAQRIQTMLQHQQQQQQYHGLRCDVLYLLAARFSYRTAANSLQWNQTFILHNRR